MGSEMCIRDRVYIDYIGTDDIQTCNSLRSKFYNRYQSVSLQLLSMAMPQLGMLPAGHANGMRFQICSLI